MLRFFHKISASGLVQGLLVLGAFVVAAGSLSTRTWGQSAPLASESSENSIASDLFQFPPSTPAALVDAAHITLKLDRAADAKAFLRQLIDLQLGENELLALREELGPAVFLDLRRDPRLLPEAQLLLTAINAAKNSRKYSENELQGFVQQLGTPGFAASTAAAALVESGTDAIPVLLAADVQSASGKVADAILKTHARALRHGLLRSMEGAESATQVRLLGLLGMSADSDLAIRLLRWQFDPQSNSEVSEAARRAILQVSESRIDVATAEEAAAILREQAERRLALAGSRFSNIEHPEIVKTLTGSSVRSLLVEEAKSLMADATILDQTNEMTSILLTVAECAAVDPRLDLDPSVVAGKASEELWAGLSHSLRLQQPAAAIEFLRGLKTVQPDEMNVAGASHVLREAILSPDARVRFLAAQLSQIQPSIEISTAAVSRTLNSAQNGSLKPEVVVVSGDDQERHSLKQVFEDAGYAPQIAESGADGFELAAEQMNCELFIVNVESPLWPVSTTLANLRADVRTRFTPVVVIGPERWRSAVTALAETYKGVWFVVQPAGTDSLLAKLAQKNLPPHILTPEDRAEMHRRAQ